MKTTTSIRIRFADIDAMGHVTNSVYLIYFEQARIDWFGKLIGSEWNWTEYGMVVVKNEVEYLRPLFLNDTCEVDTFIDHLSNKSITLSYQVYRTRKGKKRLAAKGSSVLVCFDHKTQKSIPVPTLWRDKLKEVNEKVN